MISTLLGTNKPTTRSRDLKKLHVASTVARARLTVWLRVEAYISAVRHGALRVPVPGESLVRQNRGYVHVFSLTSGSHYD